VKVVDGYVTTYIDDPNFTEHDIITKTYVTRLDGTSEFVGDYHFTGAKHPLLVLHNRFAGSPFLLYVDTALFRLIAPGQDDFATKIGQRPVPESIIYVAVAVGLLCTFVVGFLAYKFNLPTSHKIAWIVMTLITGLPGLISFFIFTNWREWLRQKKHHPAFQSV